MRSTSSSPPAFVATTHTTESPWRIRRTNSRPHRGVEHRGEGVRIEGTLRHHRIVVGKEPLRAVQRGILAFLDEDIGESVAAEGHKEFHLVTVGRPGLRHDESERIGLPPVEGVAEDGDGAGGGRPRDQENP
jgi:hypothetical protein